MYRPAAFREDDIAPISALIRDHPLGVLITSGAAGVRANLLPFLLVRDGQGHVLKAHLARANDQAADLAQGGEAVVMFLGPSAYVSPSWYATKAESGRVVPTWNYAAVEARGTPRIVDDPLWLRAQIEDLTHSQEGGRPQPWAVGDAPDDYIDAMIRAVVGVEIALHALEGKWKVSQNQPDANRLGVIDGLSGENGGSAMADLVETYLNRSRGGG
jgi:transcriptional regulator